MAEQENSKDLISVLWSGADILRSKMDANEYKNYLLGIVFYKYLSDSFLIKVYDMICDGKPESLKEALEAYMEVLQGDDAEDLRVEMKSECHYVIEPELTYTYFVDAARNNSFNREQLQKGFNSIEQSDAIFADLFADIDLYSNRLGTGDQKQSDTVASLIKEIDKKSILEESNNMILPGTIYYQEITVLIEIEVTEWTLHLTSTNAVIKGLLVNFILFLVARIVMFSSFHWY